MIENIKRITYKGFELFNDIADYELKTRNRAVVLCNIVEDNSENRRVNAKGVSLVLGYFNQVPTDEREDVKNTFSQQMKSRGFKLVA